MNERIKELAKRAWYDSLYEKYYLQEVHKREITPTEYQDIYDKKFAELIVEECISIGRETSKEIFKMSKKEGDIFEYESHGAEQVVDNIKEHFGIEE